MKKQLIAICVIAFTHFCFGQEVVSTQGDSYSNASGSLDFTIGEVVINTVSDGNNDLTQGFHQTNWNFVGLEDHQPDFEVSVFPNPVEDALNIRTSHFEEVNYALYDSRGRLVVQNVLEAELTAIDVSKLAPGAYQLTLTGADQSNLKTFKLVKNH
ncbi:MAG: T9SS type A sorting domain-containing protein [Crocinitomicaceae bacterium]|nr:T9SS type A sorting domain-containing protein [Crocinitomicaceae bacterium]